MLGVQCEVCFYIFLTHIDRASTVSGKSILRCEVHTTCEVTTVSEMSFRWTAMLAPYREIPATKNENISDKFCVYLTPAVRQTFNERGFNGQVSKNRGELRS